MRDSREVRNAFDWGGVYIMPSLTDDLLGTLRKNSGSLGYLNNLSVELIRVIWVSISPFEVNVAEQVNKNCQFVSELNRTLQIHLMFRVCSLRMS